MLPILCAGTMTAAAQDRSAEELKRMSIEELMRVEVSTVSRSLEPTMAVPAAIFVITQDDIRRSGATSLPEVLRLAPGVQVARIDAARYAIGMRGFADRLARSMLVLIDGRAVYSPLFAGTYWEVQDTVLEDIDRIEVIRGPGGTLWGANAVNGIINIITKSARDTQGAMLTATAGSAVTGPMAVRYGGRAGDNFAFRAYGKGTRRDAFADDGANQFDAWHLVQGGFRGDWTLPRSRSLTLQSDVYAARLGQRVTIAQFTPPFSDVSSRESPLSGGNVRARWTAPLGAGEYQFQTYFDRTSRDERPVAEKRNTFDLDFQHRRRLGNRHQLVWGTGYRVTRGAITTVPPTEFIPPRRTDHLFTGFAQDDIVIAPDRWRLVVGAKLEHNAYSGIEVQPSARVIWNPDTAHAVFGAVTRAVRTPSQVETDYTTTSLANPAVPAFVRLMPNPAFEAEKLTAYELGYRTQPLPYVLFSTSAFFNHHQNTLSTELLQVFVETVPAPPRLILPVTFANGLHGNSHGVEMTGDVRPLSWLRWTANYSWLRIQMTRNPASADVSQERRYEGLSPQHQLQVHTAIDLPRGVQVDWHLRSASELPAGPVPGYATSRLRLAWQPTSRIELAVVGEDLHEAQHREWPSEGGANVALRRAAHVSVTWRP